MSENTNDIRIAQAQPLITPWVLAEELPLGPPHAATITNFRRDIEDILTGADRRVLAIVGPCSVHDPEALLDFGAQFKAICEPLADAICPVSLRPAQPLVSLAHSGGDTCYFKVYGQPPRLFNPARGQTIRPQLPPKEYSGRRYRT